jgi:hypothetical protein
MVDGVCVSDDMDQRSAPGQYSLVGPNDGKYDPLLSAFGFKEGDDKGTFNRGTWASQLYQVFPLVGAIVPRTRTLALASRPRVDAFPDSDWLDRLMSCLPQALLSLGLPRLQRRRVAATHSNRSLLL